MKKGILLLALVISQNIFARTYIQCNSIDFDDFYMVVNLSETRNTMFLTTGMQNPMPNSVVRKLYLLEESETHHQYRSSDENNQMFIVDIPNNAIEEFNNNFIVGVTPYGQSEKTLTFSCYNNIFEE